MKIFLSFLVSILFLLSSCTTRNNLTAKNIVLSPLYADGMILPSERTTQISGHASPWGLLSVQISNYERLAKADETGFWQVSFPPIRNHHAFTIRISGADTVINLDDVVAGKVFFIAGNAPGDPFNTIEYRPVEAEKKVMVKIFKPAVGSGAFESGTWLNADSTELNHWLPLQVVLGETKNSETLIGLVDMSFPHAGIRSWFRPKQGEIEVFPDSVPFLFDDPVLLDSVWLLRDSSRTGLEKRIARIWFNDENWRSTALPARFAELIPANNKRIIYLRKKIQISPRFHNEDLTIELGFPWGIQEYYFNEVRIEPMKESGKIFLRIPDSLISTYSNLLCIRLFLQDEKAGIYGNSFGCYTDDSAFYASIRSDWKYNYSYETDFPPYRADYKVLSHLHDRILKMSNFPFSGIFWYDAPEEGIENRDRITAEVLSYFSSGAEKYILTPPLSPLDSILAPDVYATNDSLLQIMAERIPAEIIILNNTGCWNYSGRDFESHSE